VPNRVAALFNGDNFPICPNRLRGMINAFTILVTRLKANGTDKSA